METINNLRANSCFNNSNNMIFFIFKNYIISISKGKNKVDFLILKHLKESFI